MSSHSPLATSVQSPFVMIIFGATGDLTHWKLIPALFSLFKKKYLHQKFYIIGFARRDLTSDAFREMIGKRHIQDPLWQEFVKNIYYQQGIFEEKAGYEALIETLNTFDKEVGACITRLFYLATPPDHYDAILDNLKRTKLSEGCGQGSDKWTRLIIEKPFGKDLETARALDQKLADIFDEGQIFRVDHYLGKDTVQNMLAFRFANSIFEPIWNKEYIDHVQITNYESTDLSTRGKFFDGVGNLRDWGQNHLMQLAAAIAMEQPKHFSKEPVRDARVEALRALRRIAPDEVTRYVVRGQFDGFRNIKNVDPASDTETFVALKMHFDTQRFEDVPFYARLGKSMEKDIVEVHVVFKQTCHILFKDYGCPEIGNVLTFRFQPEDEEGIVLRVIAKKPGNAVGLGHVSMKFTYKDEFGQQGANAYEKLLIDIFAGDQMLFNRSDELESSWQFITDILEGWSREARSGSARNHGQLKFPNYQPRTMGPQAAFDLIEKDGRKWL